jgi:hypothetical protein
MWMVAAICLLALSAAAAIIPRLGSTAPDRSLGLVGSDQPSASGDASTPVVGGATTMASPTPSAAPESAIRNRGPGGTAPAGSSRTDRRYANCAQVIAAGLGPYRRGRDPEYAWYPDDDGDGWVCERARRTRAAPSPHPTKTSRP